MLALTTSRLVTRHVVVDITTGITLNYISSLVGKFESCRVVICYHSFKVKVSTQYFHILRILA